MSWEKTGWNFFVSCLWLFGFLRFVENYAANLTNHFIEAFPRLWQVLIRYEIFQSWQDYFYVVQVLLVTSANLRASIKNSILLYTMSSKWGLEIFCGQGLRLTNFSGLSLGRIKFLDSFTRWYDSHATFLRDSWILAYLLGLEWVFKGIYSLSEPISSTSCSEGDVEMAAHAVSVVRGAPIDRVLHLV